ncbi:hypothetical protein NFI96_031314 [Prochilodus magdalenae]|nr:hypothetical protein NFI96_031314 [Prochilodus magdalenae]
MAKTTFAVFLFSVVIYLTWALTVDIPNAVYEFARGDNITIPCLFNTLKPKAPITIEWTANADVDTDPDLDIVTGQFPLDGAPTVDVGEGYQGRVVLKYDIAKGIADLQLSSVTAKDTRVFTCKLIVPGDKIGKTADATKVVVLVAPSKPICNIQGKAEYYQNINLTCYSEEGTPQPTYKWTSFDVRNTPRPNPLKSTDVNGIFSLYNITSETSGFFICTSSNKIRSQACNLTLAVMPPSMNIASTAGIIGGVLAGLLFLVVLICCCCRKKKKEEEEYAMGSPEGGEYTDKDPHEIEDLQSKRVEIKPERSANQRDEYEDRSERDYDHRSDRYSDRRDDSDDRRADGRERYDDRYDDRRSDRYDDRRSDRYDDRRGDRYDDRRSDRYDDRRSDRYDDRRDQYDDRDRYDDRRNDRRDRYDDRGDRYDDRDRPALKPPRG